MKKLISSIVCLIVGISIAFSQPTLNGSTTLYGSGTQISKNDPGGAGSIDYSYGAYSIGKEAVGGVTKTYRTYFYFDLSSFPPGTQISNVQVNYTNSNYGSYTLKLTNVATISGNLSQTGLQSAMHLRCIPVCRTTETALIPLP